MTRVLNDQAQIDLDICETSSQGMNLIIMAVTLKLIGSSVRDSFIDQTKRSSATEVKSDDDGLFFRRQKESFALNLFLREPK